MNVNFDAIKKRSKLMALAVVALILLAALLYYGVLKPKRAFTLSDANERSPPTNPILVNIDKDALLPSAVCFAPAASDGKQLYMPVLYSRGTELPSHVKAYIEEASATMDAVTLSTFGDKTSEVSIKIAERYWSDIKFVVLVASYDDALTAAPLAAYLNAPLIFKGDGVSGFLSRHHVKSAILIGSANYDYDIGTKRLSDQRAVWEYYLATLKDNGDTCDYIVVTNPQDMSAEDIMIPDLSLNSAALAAHRKALVVSGDYTVDKNWLFDLGYGCGEAGAGERGEDEDELSEEQEQRLQKDINAKAIKIDNDIDEAVALMSAEGMSPQYLALVGGPAAVPMLYIKNPIWYENPQEEKGEEYLASDSYYGDLDIELDPKKNVVGGYICEGEPGAYDGNNYEYADSSLYAQELAVGRIIAPNVLDASALLARGFLYRDTPEWHSILTSRVCGDASINCAQHQRAEVFLPNGIASTRILWLLPPSPEGCWEPDDISKSHAAGDPAYMTRAHFIIYNGHGFPDGWYYWWVHADDWETSPDTVRTEDVRGLALKNSVIFSASCLCSAIDWPQIWSGEPDERRFDELGPDMYYSLALIHAGALAHIGSTELSWGMFFGGEFEGYGDFELATRYYDELLSNDLSIGDAHSAAKEDYYSDYNSPFDRTCILENVLYGEPAVNP